MFCRTEAEEEGIINKLINRLEELKKEKEHLAVEVEREEEVQGGGARAERRRKGLWCWIRALSYPHLCVLLSRCIILWRIVAKYLNATDFKCLPGKTTRVLRHFHVECLLTA